MAQDKKIVILEDDLALAKSLAQILSGNGFQIFSETG